MDPNTIALFALNASHEFGAGVAQRLGIPLNQHEEREFEDGEHKSRPLSNVRNKDVYVIQSLYTDTQQSVNDKLCRLLFFIGALKDASAARVTAVVPYLAYARKDRKSQTRDPVTTRYVAMLFEAVGVDRILTLDVHNLAAYQNAFRCHADHLEANKLFVRYFADNIKRDNIITVVSPDIGGVKRAESFRQYLSAAFGVDIDLAYMEKARAKGITTMGRLTGDVAGSTAIIIDDLISTGGTLLHAAKTCHDKGAKVVYAAASHGVFVAGADTLLETKELEKILVTDSIPPFRLTVEQIKNKLVLLTATNLFAYAIKRLHSGGSLVDLLSI